MRNCIDYKHFSKLTFNVLMKKVILLNDDLYNIIRLYVYLIILSFFKFYF